MQIIEATQNDAKVLTELTMRSKAHWGYSPDQMESWREELTITPDYLSKHPTFVEIHDRKIRGYYSFEALSTTKVELDNLFVDPDFMGKGLGGSLIKHFFRKVEEMRFELVTLDADPHAQAFYAKYGFIVVDQLASSIPGRYLPVMQLKFSR